MEKEEVEKGKGKEVEKQSQRELWAWQLGCQVDARWSWLPSLGFCVVVEAFLQIDTEKLLHIITQQLERSWTGHRQFEDQVVYGQGYHLAKFGISKLR